MRSRPRAHGLVLPAASGRFPYRSRYRVCQLLPRLVSHPYNYSPRYRLRASPHTGTAVQGSLPAFQGYQPDTGASAFRPVRAGDLFIDGASPQWQPESRAGDRGYCKVGSPQVLDTVWTPPWWWRGDLLAQQLQHCLRHELVLLVDGIEVDVNAPRMWKLVFIDRCPRRGQHVSRWRSCHTISISLTDSHHLATRFNVGTQPSAVMRSFQNCLPSWRWPG